jgi:seryl-tRNA synthetase
MLWISPVLVKEKAMFGTGFLPADESQIYKTENDDLYLVGTAEVPLAAYHYNELIPEDKLPLRYAGFSTCFRREAGAYGKDTRGMFRVHQFDKVEMFSFAHPDKSWEEHDFLVASQEKIMSGLKLPYRKVNICGGDLGAPAAKKYDLEAWLPGQNQYREMTSCSNCTDFQARRLNVRMRPDDGPNVMLHTLNGTAIALGRTLIAVMENNQQKDGSIKIPEVLVKYTGFEAISK